MKAWFPATLLTAAVLAAGCNAAPATAPAPVAPPTSTTVVTVQQTPAATTITLPPTSVPVTTSPPKATAKAPVRKATPTRRAPQYGYQCRDGDEAKYEVCAGHKAWVDGQREFTDCLDGGGTWDVDTQRCVRP